MKKKKGRVHKTAIVTQNRTPKHTLRHPPGISFPPRIDIVVTFHMFGLFDHKSCEGSGACGVSHGRIVPGQTVRAGCVSWTVGCGKAIVCGSKRGLDCVCKVGVGHDARTRGRDLQN